MSGPLRRNPHSAAFFLPIGGLVYLLYLDDSGSIGNKEETNFVLGGLCCYENNIYGLKKKLDELAETIVNEYNLDCSADDLEFHASTIWSGKGEWSNLSKQFKKGDRNGLKNARISIIKSVFKHS